MNDPPANPQVAYRNTPPPPRGGRRRRAARRPSSRHVRLLLCLAATARCGLPLLRAGPSEDLRFMVSGAGPSPRRPSLGPTPPSRERELHPGVVNMHHLHLRPQAPGRRCPNHGPSARESPASDVTPHGARFARAHRPVNPDMPTAQRCPVSKGITPTLTPKLSGSAVTGEGAMPIY